MKNDRCPEDKLCQHTTLTLDQKLYNIALDGVWRQCDLTLKEIIEPLEQLTEDHREQCSCRYCQWRIRVIKEMASRGIARTI